MTQRNNNGYQHIHAYRTWLDEHNELLRVIAVKGRDSTALNQTVSVECASVCLGRSPTAVAKQIAKLGVELLTQEELDAARKAISDSAKEFVDQYI